MSGEPVDGVIKFQLDHEERLLEQPQLEIGIEELEAWRSIFKQLGIIGQDEGKYDGYGFGNLSQRTASGFLISGTQTGYIGKTTLADYAEVTDWNPLTNSVCSRGMVKPSSESLSHAVIYEMHSEGQSEGQSEEESLVGCVFHVHSPEIWQKAMDLQIPTTDPDIEYGTPEMAEAVQKIVAENGLPSVLSMGGHEDGIIAYGRSLSETGLVLMQTLAQARK